jgi:hypothetical protein
MAFCGLVTAFGTLQRAAEKCKRNLMKKIIRRARDLKEKAAEIRQAIESAPGKVAEFREAITLSAGDLHRVRAEVQSNLSGLRAGNEDRLLQAMREINDSSYTFEDAGYELTGMDLDLSLNQRLAVQLRKFEDVPLDRLRALLSKERCDTVRSILAGIIKAEETAANVEFTHLKHDAVTVHIGSVPLIRMCWRSDTLVEESPATAPAAPISQAVPPPIPVASGIGSFFEQRSMPAPSPMTAPPILHPEPAPAPQMISPIATEPVATVVPSSPLPAAYAAEPAAPKPSPWSASALDRFKKMPDLSKH